MIATFGLRAPGVRISGVRLRMGTSRAVRPALRTSLKTSLTASAALAMVLAQAGAAHAVIFNEATASGATPGGGTVTDTDDQSVSVENANPVLTVTKTPSFTDGGAGTGAEPGDEITYTYVVTNAGNVTISGITLDDAHDGAGTAPVPGTPTLTDNGTAGDSTDDGADASYDTLAPGDTLTYTATYTVLQADVDNRGGGTGADANDDDIDNTATANGIYLADPADPDDNVPVAGSASAAVDLFVNQAITIVKTVDDETEVVAGQTLTYTYTVTNSGNTNLTEVTVTETTFTGTGTPPVPTLLSVTNNSGNSADDGADNDVDLLAPGDVATFTATYTVTQQDIDELQ